MSAIVTAEGAPEDVVVNTRRECNALCSRLAGKRARSASGEGEGDSAPRPATPLEMMQKARDGLAILDERGWNRSFHQRLFHEDFLVCPCV